MTKINVLFIMMLLSVSASADTFGNCINRCAEIKAACLGRAKTLGDQAACERAEDACDARCK